MNITNILFFIFAGLICMSAIQTITVKNSVHAALFLILTFVVASALFIMQGAEFLGLILILVYVGAVMVLFLFVVMMTNTRESSKSSIKAHKNKVYILLVFLLMSSQLTFIIYKAMINQKQNKITLDYTENLSNAAQLGQILFTEYLLAFEVVGAILLVGIVIATMLTLRQRKDTKSIEPEQQIKINAKDRLIMLDSKITK